jgi:type I restriction enzyme S subunit
MKKCWETKRLGEVCEFEGGSQPPKSYFIYEPRLGYVRFLQIRDFGSDKNITFIPESRRNRLCSEDDTMIGRYGASVGKILTGKAGAYNVALMKTIPNLKILRRKWFHNYLLSDEFQERLMNIAARSAQDGFSKEDISNFPIPVPPLPEQQRIVGLLDQAFASLATAQAHAAQNLQNARALFESHLNAVFTQRGEGWQLRRIPDVCVTFGRGKSRHRPRNEPCLYGGKYPFIQTGDISNADHVITTHTQTYNETGLAQSKLWPKGTVGIAIVGATIGETGVLDFEACFPDSVIGMTVNPAEADPFFLEYMLQHFKEMVKSHGEGSARENINLATFDRLLFPMPPVTEQRKIVEETDALKDKTKRLEDIYQHKTAVLDELKKSLLHQAFNGEL